jgi:hypothetical protein
MKKRLTKILTFLTLILFLIPGNIFAQDITFVPHDTFLSDTLGAEIIFLIDVTNVSQTDQTVFVVRTINDLPANWNSALCFDLCFASFVDSIATTIDFGSTPLTPGETREVSLHVFTSMNTGTANVQLQAGTFHNPDNRITVDFTATAIATSVENEGEQPKEYFLEQNYPNPFNPTTKISYGIREAGVVNLKVYNILGSEVTTLVNEYKSAGNYEVSFGKNELASGIYIYRLTVNNFIQTRKMILEK